MEVIPLNYTDEEERDKMAILVHLLRRMSLNYNESLRYPVNMHNMDAVKKYITMEWGGNTVSDFEEEIYFDENVGGQMTFEIGDMILVDK